MSKKSKTFLPTDYTVTLYGCYPYRESDPYEPLPSTDKWYPNTNFSTTFPQIIKTKIIDGPVRKVVISALKAVLAGADEAKALCKLALELLEDKEEGEGDNE